MEYAQQIQELRDEYGPKALALGYRMHTGITTPMITLPSEQKGTAPTRVYLAANFQPVDGLVRDDLSAVIEKIKFPKQFKGLPVLVQ